MNTDTQIRPNNLNRSLNKNVMTTYVKDYFASIPKYNVKQISNTDEFLENINNNNDFISFGLNLKFDDLSIKYDVVTKIDNVINIYLI